MRMSYIYSLYISLSICLSVPIYQSIYIYIYPSIYLSIHPSMYLFNLFYSIQSILFYSNSNSLSFNGSHSCGQIDISTRSDESLCGIFAILLRGDVERSYIALNMGSERREQRKRGERSVQMKYIFVSKSKCSFSSSKGLSLAALPTSLGAWRGGLVYCTYSSCDALSMSIHLSNLISMHQSQSLSISMSIHLGKSTWSSRLSSFSHGF